MRLRFSRSLRHVIALIALLGTTGALASIGGGPLGADACGCAAGVEMSNTNELNFGKVKTGDEKTVGFLLVNKTDNVRYTREEVINTVGNAFAKGAENCVTNTIDAPGMCEIQVDFLPTVVGQKYHGELIDAYEDLTTHGSSVQHWFIEGEGGA